MAQVHQINTENSDFKDTYNIWAVSNGHMYSLLHAKQQHVSWKQMRLENPHMVFSSTYGVKMKVVKQLEKNLKSTTHKASVVKVSKREGVHLPPLLCHINAKFMKEVHGLEIVRGYNICACKCGGVHSIELHSINRDEDGKFVDYTEDFDGMKSKYFIPLKRELTHEQITQLNMDDRTNMVHWNQSKCKCGMVKNAQTKPLDVRYFCERIRSV